MADRLETRSTRALRGLEATTIKKWESDGWELVSQTSGKVRTELTFQRPKPDRTKLIALGVGVLVLLGAAIGIGVLLEENGTPAASTTSTSRSETTSDGTTSASTTSAQTSPTPTPETSYSYAGPAYDVVIEDEGIGPAKLTEHWVVIDQVDYSTDKYQDDIKRVVSDIARTAGTTDLIAHVVTDEQIARAEAASTMDEFRAEHGDDYAINEIPKKEELGYVAIYTGGFDVDAAVASTAPEGYEIAWRPAGDAAEIERWQPAIGE